MKEEIVAGGGMTISWISSLVWFTEACRLQLKERLTIEMETIACSHPLQDNCKSSLVNSDRRYIEWFCGFIRIEASNPKNKARSIYLY